MEVAFRIGACLRRARDGPDEFQGVQKGCLKTAFERTAKKVSSPKNGQNKVLAIQRIDGAV